MRLVSSAFQNEGPIPSKYTADGEDVSPPLAWTGVPSDARSLALVVDDPDAPDPAAPTRTWVHWVVIDLPPTVHALEEGLRRLPAGAIAGVNDWHRLGWGGPSPPKGRHRYVFKLYALDRTLGLVRPTKADVEKAMAGHVLAQATLLGTYQRSGR